MALIAKEGSSFEPAPEGVFPARCIWVVDLGTQVSDGMFGHSEKHQMYVNWELVDETANNGQPMTIGAFFTVSLNPKGNLRPTLESWRGRAFTPEELKGFDIAKLINAPCLISVKHQPKADGSGIRAQVSGVMAPMRGQVIPSAREETVLLDLDAPDAKAKVEALPEWLQNKITITPEWTRMSGFDAAPTVAPANSANNSYAAAKAGVPLTSLPPARHVSAPAKQAQAQAQAQPEFADDFNDDIPF